MAAGRFVSLSGHKIKVKLAGGDKEKEFEIATDAKLTFNQDAKYDGKPCSLAMLQPGDQLNIVEEADGKPSKSLDALRCAS